MTTFSAMAALPDEHLKRATAGPRAELRRQLVAAVIHEMSKRETFDVTGPIEFTDLRGRTRYGYRATAEGRRAFVAATTVTPRRHVPTRSG